MEDRLRKFAGLVEAGSFTKAARELHVSQPALTVAINKLERELDMQLLVRGPRGFTLTAGGELAYRSAKELMDTTNNLAAGLRRIAGELPPARIGLIDSLASLLFAAGTGASKYDNLARMSVLVNNSKYLLRSVEREETDIAFVTQQVRNVSEQLTVAPAGIEPLILVCSPSIRQVTEGQLKHHERPLFISYDQPSATNRLIQAGLQVRGISASTVFYSSSPEIMLELVLRGKGMSVLPYFLVRQLLADSRLTAVCFPRPIIIDRPISTVTNKRKAVPTVLDDLPALIEQLLAEHYMAARNVPPA